MAPDSGPVEHLAPLAHADSWSLPRHAVPVRPARPPEPGSPLGPAPLAEVHPLPCPLRRSRSPCSTERASPPAPRCLLGRASPPGPPCPGPGCFVTRAAVLARGSFAARPACQPELLHRPGVVPERARAVWAANPERETARQAQPPTDAGRAPTSVSAHRGQPENEPQARSNRVSSPNSVSPAKP